MGYDISSFWERLKIILKANNYTLKKLSLYLGYNEKTLSVKQSTNVLPVTSDIISICELFNISADYLLFGSNRLSEVYSNFVSLPVEYQEIIKHNIQDYQKLCSK